MRVRRKIHFLKVNCNNYDFGRLLVDINGISEENMYSRIDGQGGGVYLKSLSRQNDMYFGVIVKLRMSGLPSLGTRNVRQTEQLGLPDDKGLAECAHFVYFERSNIIGIEYNHSGPRVANLEWHIIDRANYLHGDPVDLAFQPILDRATLRVLTDSTELNLLKMAVPRERIGSLAHFSPSIHAAFENAENFGNGGEIEIVIRMARASGTTRMNGASLLQNA